MKTAGSEITDENPDFTDDSYTGVHLAFKHALSSIVFSVRTKEDYKTANGATITLTGLSISNIGKTSTFNQGITDGNLATSAAEWDEPNHHYPILDLRRHSGNHKRHRRYIA